jgi:nitrogen regulatory protein P-II 2
MFLLDSPIIPEPSGDTRMKMIIAIIRPERLEAVQTALGAHEIYLMTVSDVRGCGRQRGFTEQYRGNQVVIRLLSKVKLEIAVNDNFVEPAVQAIKTAAHSGKIGDGKIFVLPLEEAYRIRTGESGSVAIGP